MSTDERIRLLSEQVADLGQLVNFMIDKGLEQEQRLGWLEHPGQAEVEIAVKPEPKLPVAA